MGLLHIYTGDGKGKTTASIGLAIRAAGAGMKVCFLQFMKGAVTSELNSLSLIPNISVKRSEKEFGFLWTLNEKEKQEISHIHNELILNAFAEKYDMIILDEFNIAYRYGLLDTELVEKLIDKALVNSEVILTGRDADDKFLQKADYVSEIKAVKHPYECGIQARLGIEY